MEASLDELRAAHSQKPDDEAAFARLARALHAAGLFSELAETTERHASRLADPVAQAARLVFAAEWLEHAGRAERARSLYGRAIDLDPRNAVAANSVVRLGADLRDVHRQLETFERWLARLVELRASDVERADAHLALARVSASLPGRVDKAFLHYREALALDSELTFVPDEAKALARKSRRPSEVRSFLVLSSEIERDAEKRVSVLRELARERLAPPVDLEGAIAALEDAFALSPDEVAIAHELASTRVQRATRLRGTEGGRADLARAAALEVEIARRVPTEHALPFLDSALDRVPSHEIALFLFEAHEAVAREPARLCARLLAALPELSGERETIVRRKLAAIYAMHGRPDDALEVIFPLGTPDADLAELALALCLEDGRYVDAARLAPAAFADLPTHERLAKLRSLLARVREEDEAARLLSEQILELADADDEALRTLAAVHGGARDTAGERAVLMRLVDVVDNVSERHALLRQIADLSDELGESSAAVDALYRIANADVRDASARDALRDRLARAERWNEVATIHAWEATNLDSRDARRAARDRLLALDDEIGVDPTALVRTLEAYRAFDPGDARTRDALIPRLARAGRVGEVAALRRESVDAASNDAARVAALHALADVLERGLADDEGARVALLRLLAIAPHDLDAVEQLERLAERSGEAERRVEALRRRARAVPRDERVDVLTRLGKLHEDALGQIEHALSCFEEARELAPEREDIALRLRRLYESTSRHNALSALLDELARSATHAEARFTLLRDRARLLRDVLGDRAEAADVFRAMRTLREDDEALLALISHSRATEAWLELAELARVRLSRTTDPEELRDLGMERARVLLDHLADPVAAEAQLLEVRVAAPSHVPAVERLSALYEDLGEPAKLASTIADHLALVTQLPLRVALARRLAELHMGPVPDRSRAIEALLAWSKAAPFDLEPYRSLDAQLPEGADAERARALESLTVELAKKIDRARRDARAASAADVAEAVSSALRAAELLTTRLEDPDRGSRVLVRALDLGRDASHEVERCIAMSDTLDRHLGVERFRRRVAAEIVTHARHAVRPHKDHLYLRAAELLGATLGDDDGAFAIVRDAMPELPANASARLALVAYGTAAGAADDLDRVLAERVEASVDALDARALLRERARLLFERSLFHEASDQYLRLVAMEPNDDELRTRHRVCLAHSGRHQELLLALDQAVRRAEPGSDERLELLREIAQTWEGPLANRFEAGDAWKAVLRERPGDGEAALAVERLATRSRLGFEEPITGKHDSVRPSDA